MMAQGARPGYCCERVRGWTVIASTPSPSAMRAISTAFTVRSSHPERILMVNGTSTAFRSVRKMTAARSGSRMSAAPCPLATIFETGQPMLRSIPSAPVAASRRAASASTSGSPPRSWKAMGRSSGRQWAITWVRALPSTRARASISSLVRSPAPASRQTSRNGALVTPAIGASRRSIGSRLILQLAQELDDPTGDAEVFARLLVVAHDRAHLPAVTQELAQLAAQRVLQVGDELLGALLLGRYRRLGGAILGQRRGRRARQHLQPRAALGDDLDHEDAARRRSRGQIDLDPVGRADRIRHVAFHHERLAGRDRLDRRRVLGAGGLTRPAREDVVVERRGLGLDAGEGSRMDERLGPPDVLGPDGVDVALDERLLLGRERRILSEGLRETTEQARDEQQ